MLLAVVTTAGFLALEPGLDLGVFDAHLRSTVGDSKVTVLRVDPAEFELVLLNANASKTGASRTAKDWADANGLVAAINPSMFHPDGRSTALMRTRGHVNNPKRSKDKNTLVFEGTRAAILDADCDDPAAAADWDSAIQSIRMLSCKGVNVWARTKRIWSHAAVGVDTRGRVLFFHARSPWTTHDFIEIARKLPVDLARLQYAEGGPEASLYVKGHVDLAGSYETGFNENDDNDHAWPLPNILGVKRR